MLISLIRYIQGYLKIRVTGYSPERFLNLCKNKKISVWGLKSSHNAYDMYITVSGFRKIKPILRKTQTKVSIIERFGLPFFFHKYRKRKLFFIGVGISAFIIYCMTFFIWNIDLDGNQTITDDVLMEYLESHHIYHGMFKHKVDCDQIVKDIRKNFDEIIWVSVSMDGTRLFIQVKENADNFHALEEAEPSDIIANKSGVVVSIITRNGVPLIKPGDVVTNGDLIISGTIDVLNDAKEVVSQNYVKADADIVLQTTEVYEDYIAKEYEVKNYTKKKKSALNIKCGNYHFRLGVLKNSYKSSETHTSENQVKIGENFYLPLSFGKTKIIEYQTQTKEYTNEELETLLRTNFEYYCNELEEKGVVILEKNLQITYDQGGARAYATLTLHESVGISRKIIAF